VCEFGMMFLVAMNAECRESVWDWVAEGGTLKPV
jgi:hypothetical protein